MSMNSSKYTMNSYVPTNQTNCQVSRFTYKITRNDVNEVVNNPERHFDSVYVTNFDL